MQDAIPTDTPGASAFGSAPATRHVSEAGGFGFAVPGGWVADTDEQLDQINARAAELGGPGVAAYTAGFRPEGPPEAWAWLGEDAPAPADVIAPFVLVQEIAIAAEERSREAIANWVINDLAEESNLGEPGFNLQTMTVVARGEQPVPAPPGVEAPARTMVSTTTGFVGRERVVYLHAYTDARIAEAAVSQFERMTDTFAFTQASAYAEVIDPGPGGGAPGSGIPGGMLLLGIAGVVVVMISVMITYRALRR